MLPVRGEIIMTWTVIAAFATGLVIGAALGLFGMAALAASND